MELHIRFGLKRPKAKTVILITTILLILLLLLWFLWLKPTPSSIPSTVRHQADFKTVSVSPKLVKADSYQYVEQAKTITFNATASNQAIVITEQKAPDNLTTGTGVYFQSLGLHPIAQFSVKAGPVAILNFYQTGTLAVAGQAGALVAGKTLVLAHLSDPKAKLTNDQWHQFFDSFTLDK